jgi:collagen beta-1,O-galactosyltransferase
MNIDKIYIISLKKNRERANSVIQELNKLGGIFLNSSIFDAIDGSKLNKNEINNYLSIKAQYTLKNPHTYDEIRTVGEIGCYLSHYKIWKDIIFNDYKNCIIFEDDAFAKENYETIMNYITTIPNDYDIAYLGWWNRYSYDYTKENNNWLYTDKLKLINNKDNIKNKSMILGLYSYILSNNGAKKLITKAMPIDLQVDSFISLYNDINKDFKRYLSKNQLFKAGESIGNTHNKCYRCKFYEQKIINYIKQK